MARIEIFKTGTHTPLQGDVIAFGEAELDASAAAYDPAKHEAPLVVGHPKHDHPAYGWVRSLTAEGGSLYAEPHQVDAAFAEIVGAGRYKKISASFYRPDAAGNPVPGVYYLKHVGFLGAHPPAVKGLRSVSFAEDDAAEVVTVEFGEAPRPWVFRTIAELLRGVREWVIAEKGTETADQVMPSWRIDSVIDEAARLEAAPQSAGFHEHPTSEETIDVTTKTPAGTPSAEELARRAQQLQQQEAAFAERERGFRRQEAERFVDDLVGEAKLPAGIRAGVLQFMERLDTGEVIEFGEGENKAGRTMLDQFKALLQGLPASVAFGEHARPEDVSADTADFAAPAGYAVDPMQLDLHRRALAHQRANPGTDYVAAVRAVSTRK